MALRQSERLDPSQYQARLRQLGAQYRADRSSTKAHVFWLPAARAWLKAYRKGNVVTLEVHDTCPCSQA